MANKYTVTSTCVSYNCAMATINHLFVKKAGAYVSEEDLEKDRDLIIKTWFEFLHKGGWPGQYNANIVSFVFHDNVKNNGMGSTKPLCGLSELFQYLYNNQEKYKCYVVRGPLMDNLWHEPAGSHPGRTWILYPPHTQIYDKDSKITEAEKKNLHNLLTNDYYNLDQEDKKIIKALVA